MLTDRRTAIRTVTQAAAGLAIARRGGIVAAPVADTCDGATVAEFTRRCFTDGTGVQRVFYDTETDGPTVIVLHELPGLIEVDLNAGRRLAKGGYRVVMPLFFGEAGEKSSFWKTFRYTRKHCNRREFACGAAEETSPHVLWLRERAARMWKEHAVGRGVGAVGMCLTGALPIAMLGDPKQPGDTPLKAAVACQPTVPFNLFTPLGLFTKKSGLGMAKADLDAAKGVTAPILAIRFASEPLCTNARFRRLTAEFENRFYRMDFTGAGHSTLGKHLCEIAVQEVLAFFNGTLRDTPDTSMPRFPIMSRANSRDEIWVSCGQHR